MSPSLFLDGAESQSELLGHKKSQKNHWAIKIYWGSREPSFARSAQLNCRHASLMENTCQHASILFGSSSIYICFFNAVNIYFLAFDQKIYFFAMFKTYLAPLTELEGL
jgi:hypothetical protein